MAGVKGRSGGNNAKTVEQHHLEGTFNTTRHSGYVNPEPPPGLPTPPKVLTGDAEEEWDRMVRRLQTSKTVSVIDDGALYQYVRLFAETEAIAVTQLETAGSIQILEENIAGLKGPDLVAVFQEISKLRQLEARYTNQIRQGRMAQRVFLVEFGMTPASRGRVRLTDTKDEKTQSPIAELKRRAADLRRVK